MKDGLEETDQKKFQKDRLKDSPANRAVFAVKHR